MLALIMTKSENMLVNNKKCFYLIKLIFTKKISIIILLYTLMQV